MMIMKLSSGVCGGSRVPALWSREPAHVRVSGETRIRSLTTNCQNGPESEEVEGQPFHNLDQEVLVKALKTLEVQKKAEIFGSNEGVKFF